MGARCDHLSIAAASYYFNTIKYHYGIDFSVHPFYACLVTKTSRGEETVQIGVRLPKGLHKILTQKAKDERRSLNEQLIWLLEQMLMPKK